MASAALEMSQTPTRRVRKVRFWSCPLCQLLHRRRKEQAYIHVWLFGRRVLFVWRDGAVDRLLERLVEFLHILPVSLDHVR